MKKFVVGLLISILIIGCGKSDEKKNQTNNQNSLKVATEKGPVVKLKYKFNKGDKFDYKLQTNANNIEEISADTTIKNEINQTATYIFNFLVTDVDEYNNADIRVTINSIIAETVFNGQSVKYDSKLLYSTREKVQFVDYEAVKKVPFKIRVNQIGQVILVDNVNQIMKNILEIQKVPDTLSAKTKEKMRTNIANGTLMPLTQQIFKVFTENEVGVDSTWQLKYTTPLAVFQVENIANYKITDLKLIPDTTTTIASSLQINVTGNNVVSEKGVTYTFSQPQLSATGNVKYNQSKGLVEFSESTTALEMMMFLDGKDPNNKPIKSTKKDISNNTNIVELL